MSSHQQFIYTDNIIMFPFVTKIQEPSIHLKNSYEIKIKTNFTFDFKLFLNGLYIIVGLKMQFCWTKNVRIFEMLY
jgi:hypothetical protein